MSKSEPSVAGIVLFLVGCSIALGLLVWGMRSIQHPAPVPPAPIVINIRVEQPEQAGRAVDSLLPALAKMKVHER